MVQITGYRKVTTEEGDTYIRLLLSGGLEMVKSDKTGNFYATVRKCSISSTFDEVTASAMIGEEIPGSIIKQEVEPYEYELESGEMIKLSHRWVYIDEVDTDNLTVSNLIDEVNSSSKNGSTNHVELAS